MIDKPSSLYHDVVMRNNNIDITFSVEEIETHVSIVVKRKAGSDDIYYYALTSADQRKKYHKHVYDIFSIIAEPQSSIIEQEIRTWYRSKKRTRDKRMLISLLFSLLQELIRTFEDAA